MMETFDVSKLNALAFEAINQKGNGDMDRYIYQDGQGLGSFFGSLMKRALPLLGKTLFSLVDRYIPSISIKSDFTSPWFDAECFEAYRNKDRAHKKFKNYSRIEGNTQNIVQSEINFKYKRQLFKNMCNKKMRDNLYNEDDPGLITKKFWSHVKSNSKSSRLPETMH